MTSPTMAIPADHEADIKLKACPGVPSLGIDRHVPINQTREALVAIFGVDKSNKDGMGRRCNVCGSAYTKSLRIKKAAAAGTTPKAAKPATLPPVVPTDLPSTLDEVETDEGQAKLAAAADAAKRSRQDARNAAQRERRAAAKATVQA